MATLVWFAFGTAGPLGCRVTTRIWRYSCIFPCILNLWATMIRDLMIGGGPVEDTLAVAAGGCISTTPSLPLADDRSNHRHTAAGQRDCRKERAGACHLKLRAGMQDALLRVSLRIRRGLCSAGIRFVLSNVLQEAHSEADLVDAVQQAVFLE